jgi:HKD family nuclease
MITLCRSDAILDLLDRVEHAGARFREVAISVPFIDEFGAGLLRRVANAADRRFSLRVVTRPEVYSLLVRHLWPDPRTSLLFVPGLHAKAYGALGFASVDHEAIIASTNLTEAGLMRNIELGLRVRASDRSYESLAERVVAWTRATAIDSRTRMPVARR